MLRTVVCTARAIYVRAHLGPVSDHHLANRARCKLHLPWQRREVRSTCYHRQLHGELSAVVAELQQLFGPLIRWHDTKVQHLRLHLQHAGQAAALHWQPQVLAGCQVHLQHVTRQETAKMALIQQPSPNCMHLPQSLHQSQRQHRRMSLRLAPASLAAVPLCVCVCVCVCVCGTAAVPLKRFS
jgi:hypothetical protein